MKIYNDLEQGTEEWHTVRLGKFTASDAYAIASNGKGLETLCFEKVAEIKTGKTKESYTNGDIDRGKELESLARSSYEVETGIVATQVGFIEEDERVGCSPDGLVEDNGLVEIKCKSDSNYVKYLYDGKIDPAHEWQMQMQMLITGRKWVDYVVFNPNFEKTVSIVRVKRNEESIKALQAGIAKGKETVEKILAKI